MLIENLHQKTVFNRKYFNIFNGERRITASSNSFKNSIRKHMYRLGSHVQKKIQFTRELLMHHTMNFKEEFCEIINEFCI